MRESPQGTIAQTDEHQALRKAHVRDGVSIANTENTVRNHLGAGERHHVFFLHRSEAADVTNPVERISRSGRESRPEETAKEDEAAPIQIRGSRGGAVGRAAHEQRRMTNQQMEWSRTKHLGAADWVQQQRATCLWMQEHANCSRYAASHLLGVCRGVDL